ncbi:hypothetical protein F5B21DRAFT_460204 [Xylaria acuta]|nr:hypothetical protein F5B21DRAFT_460204 [Xylaria acuta]
MQSVDSIYLGAQLARALFLPTYLQGFAHWLLLLLARYQAGLGQCHVAVSHAYYVKYAIPTLRLGYSDGCLIGKQSLEEERRPM